MAARKTKSKEKKLGVAEKKRRYDLPLNNSEGTDFLILLVALMTFLAATALSSSFVLHALGERWSSGLENKATIEIPAETKNGQLRSTPQIQRLSIQARDFMNDQPGITSAEIMDESKIHDLISPWLGESATLEDIPLPGLIAVEFKENSSTDVALLRQELKNISSDIRIDTHESWLNDILRFTSALQIAAISLVLIISATTIIAIAGAIRSRIAIYKADVELLHLMGARDSYISRQFVRHAVILTFKGSVIGALFASAALYLISLLSAKSEAVLIPDFSISPVQTGILASVPIIACIIGGITARYTVLRSLAQMP